MNILLVEPKKSKNWGKNNQYVGLLRIGNWLIQEGNNVQYIQFPNLPKFVPDEIYVTSMFTYDYKMVWDAIDFYKKRYPKSYIRLGGIYATICPDHTAKSGADEVIAGQHPEGKEYPPDPSILPYEQDFAYLFTSYGCNRACTYCATHILYGAGIRQLSPDRVLSDIVFLRKKGFKKIYFGDDNILYNSENHINKVLEEIIRNKIKVEIHIPGGMAGKDFTKETAFLMKKAGVTEISFAIESVSADVRKKMGRAKGTTEDDLETALQYADAAGFKRNEINTYFIIGLPYQKVEDMSETLVYLLKLGVWAHPQRLTPIPNTIDWKRMKLENVDYSDLDYKTFVAPSEDFTEDDLDKIYKIARYYNIGNRYTGGYNIFTDDSKVSNKVNEVIRKE